MTAKPRGKPEFFSKAQNEALRKELHKHILTWPEKERTGSRVGELLGVSQQTASRYVRKGDIGFSYDTGTIIARLAGFRGVDDFFLASGVGHPDDRSLGVWHVRDTAMSIARGRGVPAEVLELVVAMHSSSQNQRKTMPWWDEEIRVAHDDWVRERATDEAAGKLRAKRSEPVPTDAAPKSVGKRRRAAG